MCKEDIALACVIAAYFKNINGTRENLVVPLAKLNEFAGLCLSHASVTLDTLSFVQQDRALRSLLGSGRVVYVSPEHDSRWSASRPHFTCGKVEAFNKLKSLTPPAVAIYVDKQVSNVFVFSNNMFSMVNVERQDLLLRKVLPAQLALAISDRGELTIFEETVA